MGFFTAGVAHVGVEKRIAGDSVEVHGSSS
jgi:hypothetical protein